VLSRGPSCYGIASVVNQSCYCESNHCYPAGYDLRGLPRERPEAKGGSRDAAEGDPTPRILQLNTKGLPTNKMSLIAQLEYTNKAFIIVLKETPCATADKLVIPKFSLAGLVLSRNTFHVCSRAAA